VHYIYLEEQLDLTLRILIAGQRIPHNRVCRIRYALLLLLLLLLLQVHYI
jgi:hypothetical protein